MIDTKSLISNVLQALAMKANRVPGENLGHRSTPSRIISNNRVVLDGRIDIHVLASKAIDAHSDNNRCCRAHDNNDRVCGRITEPCLFEVVGVHFLCSKKTKMGRTAGQQEAGVKSQHGSLGPRDGKGEQAARMCSILPEHPDTLGGQQSMRQGDVQPE
jgi:hypothetical protein